MTDNHNPVNHTCNKTALSFEPDENSVYRLAELFKIFGDGTRLKILTALLSGEMCVIHIAEHLGMGQSAISHQLRILRTSGLVKPRRDGKTIYYSLDDEHIKQILDAGLEHIHHREG